jgi:two-component system NarL family sensor kinase
MTHSFPKYGLCYLLMLVVSIALAQSDSTITVLQKSLQTAKNERSVVQAHLELAETYMEQGESQKALDHLQEASAISWRIRFREGSLDANYRLGTLYFETDELDKADVLFTKIIQIANRRQDQLILSQTYNAKAKIHSWKGELLEANRLLREARTLALQLPDKFIALDILNQLATNYKNQQGKLDSARLYFEEMIYLKKQTKQTEGLVNDYRELAEVYQQQGNLPKTQEYLLQAFVNAADTLQKIEILTELGNTFLVQKRWDKAREYLESALQLTNQKSYPFKEAELFFAFGNSFENQGDKVKALEFYRQSLARFETIGNEMKMAKVMVPLARLSQNPADYQTAFNYLQKVLLIRTQNQEQLGILETKLEMGKLLVQMGKAAPAITILQESLDIAKATNSKEFLYQTYASLAEAYALAEDFKLAYDFQRRYQIQGDSIFNEKQTRIVNEINTAYETERLKNDLQQRELEKNRADLRRRRSENLLLIVVLVGTLTIAMLWFLNYRTKKQQQIQQKEMLAMEKERESQHLRSMIMGEEQERTRIARELHDGLGTLLATVKLHFNAVENDVPIVKQSKLFEKADELLDDACSEVRKISYNMMPGILSEYGLEYATQDLCDSIAQAENLDVHFIPHGLEKGLDSPVEIAIYRIIQELLKNIWKHAQSSEVIVQLTAEDRQLNLIVEDNGIGFNVEKILQQPGIGLESIQSRVALLQGQLQIDSHPGEGTTVTIDIPLNGRG